MVYLLFVVHESETSSWMHVLCGRLKKQSLPWTELMDKALLAAHKERSATSADVKAACAKVPMHPQMKEASMYVAAFCFALALLVMSMVIDCNASPS